MLLRVRVKGIIEGLIENTAIGKIPSPLISFLQNMTRDGQFVANNWLTPWELNRIDTDNYGTMLELDENQRKMISSIYLYAKIMVIRVLLDEA